MPSAWICMLLCLSIVGGCGGEDERKTNNIDKVKEEIVKKNDYDDGEDGSSVSSNVEENVHQYAGIMTKGEKYNAMIDREHENEDRERDTIGKGGTEWRHEEKRNEEVNKKTGNIFATKYLPELSINEREQAEGSRGNAAMQRKRGESPENVEMNKENFHISEYDVKKQRQNTITEKGEMKNRRGVQGKRIGREKKTKREGPERQRNNRGQRVGGLFEGNGHYQSYRNYKIEQERKVESKIGRRRRRGGRRLKGQRKRSRRANGNRYYNKYGYENERSKGYKENRKHRKPPVHKSVEHGGRGRKSQGNSGRRRVKFYSHSYENIVGRKRKLNRNKKKKIFRVDGNGETWKKRPAALKKQRYRGNRKTNRERHGRHVRIKNYTTNRKTNVGEITKMRKITASNKKGNRKKFTKGRQKTKMLGYKENRKKKKGGNYGNNFRKYNKYKINSKAKMGNRKTARRKGYRKKLNWQKQKIKVYHYKEKKKRKGSNYGNYFRKYNMRKAYKKVRLRSRNSFRRKQKSRIFNRKGKKGKMWCPLSRNNISAKYIKQLMHAYAYSQLRYMQNLQKCRSPEWYTKRFGAARGYRAWLHCWQIQWRKLGTKTARYLRKRKPAKCGRQHYKPTEEFCCRGNLYKKRNGVKCCGTNIYNMTSQFCWNNTVFNSSTHSLCNSVAYNHLERFCYNGSIYDKNGRHGICCKGLYDRVSQFCYKCKIYLKCCYSRCGNEIYYVKNKFCYHDCLFDRKLYDVCGGRVISRSKYTCVDNVIQTRQNENSKNVASRKRELQGHGEYAEGKKKKVMEKRSISFACQEMVYS